MRLWNGHFLARRMQAGGCALALALACVPVGAAAQQSSANIAWSDYPGWRMITGALSDAVLGAGPYPQVKAVELYKRGVADMLAISNVDLLDEIAEDSRMPDTVILFPTSISEGADKIVAAQGVDPAGLTGRRIGLVRNSASHYVLDHAIKYNRSRLGGAPNLVFLGEDDLVAAFEAGRVDAVIGRDPMISRATQIRQAQVIYDSRDLNHAIIDLVVMRRDVYEAAPWLARRLVDGWFSKFDRADDGSVRVAEAFNIEQIENRYFIEGQGISRRGFATIASAHAMMESGRLKFAILRAKDFVDLHTVSQPGMPSLGTYGIRFADGTVIGNPQKVRIEVRTDHLEQPSPDG